MKGIKVGVKKGGQKVNIVGVMSKILWVNILLTYYIKNNFKNKSFLMENKNYYLKVDETENLCLGIIFYSCYFFKETFQNLNDSSAVADTNSSPVWESFK